MKKIFSGLLLVAVPFFGIAGCATMPIPEPYNQKALGLKIGMEKETVISILGNPKKVAARQTERGLEEKYSYWGISRLAYSYALVDNEMVSQDRLYVTLLNNKVVEWGDKYDPSAMMEKSLQMTSETVKSYSEMYQKQLDLQKSK